MHPEINIGMAVSLDADGLIVPVIRNAGPALPVPGCPGSQ